SWQRALDDWMAVENLEERAAAPGWIDGRVLQVLRARR
ncbi:MAG: putative peptidoglycan binding domain, partial [Chloroflexota bacterium]|nr:putative peptidoglycan binding domain [Chloroflexota bacterium]